MEEIVLLSSNKTKNGNVILRYGYKDPKEKFTKGYLVLEQWLNDSKVYDNLTDDDFGAIYSCEFGYKDTFNGQARKVITKLIDSNGEVIYQEK